MGFASQFDHKKEAAEAIMPFGFTRQPSSQHSHTCSVASSSLWSPFRFLPEISSSHVNSSESVTSPNGLKSISQIFPYNETTEELKQAVKF